VSKTVIFLFHGDDESLAAGLAAAWRTHVAAPDLGVQLEVFCLGPAQAALADGAADPVRAATREQVGRLIAAGVAVGASVDGARSDGTEAALRSLGLTLEDSGEAFIRYALDGAAVLSF
jgi:hypothetical protein